MRVLPLALAAIAATVGPVLAQEPDPAPRMAKAAGTLLGTLDAAQRARASLPFNSEERLNWGYVPKQRQGVSFRQMSAAQRQSAMALLEASLSARGFTKVDTIRRLESVLRAMSGSSIRDPDLYFFTVFGVPSEKGGWGWRYEGHHVSLNWTILDGRLAASTPQFLGANPADVREGAGVPGATRALAAEEDLGRALVKSLDAEQAREAILSRKAPAEILTGDDRDAAIQEDKGISWAKLRPEQQGLLLSLVQEYAGAQSPAVAQARLSRIKSALPNVKFAWMGGVEKGQGHYYRIQGPTFLIEYDNTQDHANHIHCVWREFKGDWGRDVLADHYRTASHHARRERS
jgi:hypothetical protein